MTVYVEALRERVIGARLHGLRLATPFVLRSSIRARRGLGRSVTACALVSASWWHWTRAFVVIH